MTRKKKIAKPVPAQRPAPRGRLWILLAAALVPLFVYWPTTGHGFLLDDFVLFQKSPSLSDLGSIPQGFLTDVGALRKGTPTVISSYYRPVFLALSTLYYQIAGGGPAGWHTAAILLAALIGALACGFFLRLGWAPLIALLASLVFSLHPAHVSSVAWASGIQELCAAFFVLCALHALLTVQREDRRAPLVRAALFYALALLSKEVATALLPFTAVWAFYESKIDPQGARRLWRATAVLAGVAAVYLAVRVAVLGGLAVPAESAPSFQASLPAVPVALFTYLRLLVWPVGFSIFRPERPVYGPFAEPVLLAMAALAILAGLTWWILRKRRDLALPLAWVVIWLLPVLNLWALHPQWMVTDRYLFLPSLALPWLLLVSLRERRVLIATLSVLAVVFALLTFRYSAIFKDERTFLAAMEKAEPTSPLVFAEKGRLLRESGNLTGARAALIRAVELDPTGPAALESLGDLEMARGDLDAAESYYRRALVVRPYASRGFKLVALARSRAGQSERAMSLIEESAQRWPEDFEVQLLRALFLGAAGQREKAQAAYDAARRIRPDDPAVAGSFDEALARLLPTVLPPYGR
ncbi:MAG TPA: tetratricopeptide repeat protein [Thermoanaerobaculia bacterium]